MTVKMSTIVLVDARDQFQRILIQQMSDVVWEGFASMYQAACEHTQPLMVFQGLCREVKGWNSDTIAQATKGVYEQVPYLEQLLRAILVTNVRILTSVQSGGEGLLPRVQIPNADTFVFNVYKNCARKFYHAPQLFDQSLDAQHVHANVGKSYETIAQTIADTIRSSIPYASIVEYYKDPPSSGRPEPNPNRNPNRKRSRNRNRKRKRNRKRNRSRNLSRKRKRNR